MSDKQPEDDRPEQISGERLIADELRYSTLPATEPTMPVSRRVSGTMVSQPGVIAPGLDIETVVALLDSHAQVGNVGLEIRTPSGEMLFSAYPPNRREGEEHEVSLKLKGYPDGVRLRGALPVSALGAIADALEQLVELRDISGERLQALSEERQRLSLMFDFSEKVCQLAGFEDVVNRFLRDVTRILDAREGTFFAIDQRRKELYIRCHHGSRPEVVKGFRLKIGEGIAGAVAKDGRARIVNDVQSCPDYVVKNNPINNIISAPVTMRNAIIGVVNVNDRAEGQKPFSNRDLQLLVSLARLGGVALDNAKLFQEVRQLLLSTVESLTVAIDAKDQRAIGHSRRVAFLCGRMADRLELSVKERDLLRLAAMLHDVGNLAVSESVLKKPGPLSREELAQMREHPSFGASILSPVQLLSQVLPGVVDHHERYDGRGYPRRLKAEEISLQGRLVAIADAFDAMVHDRPFRKAWSAADAIAEITRHSGTQFDPALVPVFVECYRDLELDQTPLDDLIPAGLLLDF